jgi:hypothetical protein
VGRDEDEWIRESVRGWEKREEYKRSGKGEIKKREKGKKVKRKKYKI